ncbi:MAG: hypothetical protein QM756_13945 [Polyangiaceae bacterium]
MAEELAEFFYDHPVGKARLLWHSGRTLEIDRGTAPSSGDDYEAVFSDQEHTSEAWLEQSRQYEAAQQVRHGACAVARAAASAKSGQPLRDWLTTHVVALQPARARELAEELERDAEGNVARLLSALLLGAEPWVVFRMVATALANRPRAAHDFVDAALLLTPGDSDCLWTRAMTRLELGRIADALGDAEHVTQASPTLGAFIRDYARLLFPSWRFLAADELVSASFDGLSEAPLQPLSEVRRVVQVYATRLLLLRQAVLARSGVPSDSAWLPPALTALLPHGPVPLQRYAATIVDAPDNENPPSDENVGSEVLIDEVLELSAATPLLELQARARCEWAALCWLCWAVGLTEVSLPDCIDAPPNFAAAASMHIARAARAADAVATGGMRARAEGVPGFEWEGKAIDELPRSFAQLACNEYAELRALFLWLCFAENRSPFQSDLRSFD